MSCTRFAIASTTVCWAKSSKALLVVVSSSTQCKLLMRAQAMDRISLFVSVVQMAVSGATVSFSPSTHWDTYESKKQMRVYVAGKFSEKKQAHSVMCQVRSLGHEVTYDWTQFSEERTPQSMQRAANLDLQGVLDADAVLALLTDPSYTYRGTFFELGAALATGKRVLVVCAAPDTSQCCTTCFYFANGIEHYATVTDALLAL